MKKSSRSSVSKSKTAVSSKTKNVNDKEFLVSEFAARWWYVLPDWPPEKYDYTSKLTENKLRAVPAERFPIEPEEDEAGNKKVTEVE